MAKPSTDAMNAGKRRAAAYAAQLDRSCACGAELHNEVRDFTVAGTVVNGWRAVCDECGYVSTLFEPVVRFRNRHPIEVRDRARVRSGTRP